MNDQGNEKVGVTERNTGENEIKHKDDSTLEICERKERQDKKKTSPPDDLSPPMKALPDTVLLKVFSYLPEEQVCKVASVCEAWKRVAYDSSLWESVDLRRFHTTLDEIRLTRLIRSRMIPLLQKLNLGGLSLSPRVFQILTKDCPKLKVLCLESVTFLENFNATENCFPNGLSTLDLRHSSGDESAFQVIAQNVRQVENLGLSDHCITSLIVSNDLDAVFPRLSNVRVLEFSYCVALTDTMISDIALYSKSLRSLCLRRCNTFQGASLALLIASCPLLTSLVLDGTCVNDSALRAVDWENSALTEVDLSWCRHLSSEGLKAMLPHLSKLRYLRLCCVGYGHAVTDDLLYVMSATRNQTLEILDMSYSGSVTDTALGYFAIEHEALLYLRMHHCRLITPKIMDLIPQDSQVFIVANFPIDNEGMVLNSELLNRYTYWPTPIYMRDWSLDQRMGWR
ncbi:F-box/LRR-repeat protein 20-like [Actinia tenebrosa]|uniref:F-box/LRR-repeat protein 20-like n=1 Tax=Actinia tenebrosa TaxID=6105 RepID=A0A6P8I7Q7_ACTTE|nr:F-box/LRR-repeat protein 20-like [Actinia tenebrosa]